MRLRRQHLTAPQQRRAAMQAFHHLRQLGLLRPRQRIAIYLGNDGEIDPRLFLHLLRRLHLEIYLPVLHPLKHNSLLFATYRHQQALQPNRYGIDEPVLRQSRIAHARQLDVILMPLVAFDAQGNRLGMGGGYYDRALEFKRQHYTARPLLFGLAHAFQQMEKLPEAPWDVPMDGIVTDQGAKRLKRAG